MLIVVGLGLIGVLAVIIVSSQRRLRQPDLGYVSQQWLSEHRMSQSQDPHR